MTTYPGDDPQTPDDPQHPAHRPPEDQVSAPETPYSTEPTQPVGYWERRANEQAGGQAQARGDQPYPTTPYPQGGPVFNPTSSQQKPYAQPGPTPYGAQPPGSPPALGQPGPYAPIPPYAGYGVRPPDHPQATLALVLGLVGVVGAFIFCGVTLLVSPFAWGVGHSALKDIRASQGQIGGESQARTGMILGIVGTALLILAVVVLTLIFVAAIASDPSSTTGSSV